jgi:phospholipase C
MDHVVLVLFENRSFDNLLGHLYTPVEKPGFEGVIGKNLMNPVPQGAAPIPPGAEQPEPDMVHYSVAPGWEVPDPDPGEEYQHTNTQLYGILDAGNWGIPARHMTTNNEPAPGAPATMDGFVLDYISTYETLRDRPPSYEEYRQIMQGHTRDHAPVLHALARGFAVFDHWFSEVPSQTFPNRSFWTAASSSGLVVNSPPTEYYFHNTSETIFDRLDDHGRTWKVYVLEPCPLSITGAIHTPRLKKHFHDRFVPFSEFEADVAAGTLPDFALIEPNLLAGHADYHPPFGDALVEGADIPMDPSSAIVAGELFLAHLYGTIKGAPQEGASNLWNTTLFIGWDEPGGTYDHVPPPAAVPPDPDDEVGQFGFRFDRSGGRVPAIVVSPWVSEGTVESEEYRHTSMIATLRKTWGLGEPLSCRDASARTFEHLFSPGTPRPPDDWPSVDDHGLPELVVDPTTYSEALGSLGRHLVHGLAHLATHEGRHARASDYADDNDIDVPTDAFVAAAATFGRYFFPRLGHALPAAALPPVRPPAGTTVARPEAIPGVAPGTPRHDLGLGFAVVFGFPQLDAVEVSLVHGKRTLWHHTFDRHRDDADEPEATPDEHVVTIPLGLARLQFHLDADLFDGTVAWQAELSHRAWFTRPWSRRRQWSRASVAIDPSIGVIDGRTAFTPPAVDDPTYGRSQSCTDTILRFHVADEERKVCNVGQLVKQRMFPPPYQPFVFNAVACVGAFTREGPQCYANPRSPWFNVFLGYYQIDCDRALWSRPFGFEAAAGYTSEPRIEDLVRLGKADWNYFSNWDYGVPETVLWPYDRVSVHSNDYTDGGMEEIGGRWWHRIDLLGVEVASAYVSDAPGALRLVDNTVVAGMIRDSFGYPQSDPLHPNSFIPKRLDAALRMAYFEDDDGYHTLIFGGTAHTGRDAGLLQAEVDAVEAVIAGHYAERGFERPHGPGPAPDPAPDPGSGPPSVPGS